MNLLITPTYAHLSGRIPLEAVTMLTQMLRYRDNRNFFKPAYRFRHAISGSEWISVMRLVRGVYVFPAGLSQRVLKSLTTLGPVDVQYPEPGHLQYVEPITPTYASSPLPDGTVLFPDQIDAVDAVVRHQRGLLNYAVNAGKTQIIAGILTAYGDQPGLVLVDGQEQLQEEETYGRLQRLLQEPLGRLGAGRHRVGNERVTLAMIQTLHARRERPEIQALLKRTRVLIIDECHVVSVAQWFPVLGTCTAPVRVGLSGSVRDVPHRIARGAAGLIEEAFLGPILLELKDEELVAQGRSAEPLILMPYVRTDLPFTREFDELYEPGIVRNAPRNQIMAETAALLAAQGLRTLALFYRREHGDRLTELMRAQNLRVECVHGGHDLDQRKEFKRGFVAGELDAIVASNVWRKAVNIPEVEGYINAAGWKSPLATGQGLGRALRRKMDNRVLVLDPYDLGQTLDRHSEQREKFYLSKGHTVIKGTWDELRPLVAGFRSASGQRAEHHKDDLTRTG